MKKDIRSLYDFCLRKNKYTTYEKALEKAKEYNGKYHCIYCNRYHITTKE